MRRLALIVAVVAAGAGALAGGGVSWGEEEERRYWVEMDNAFGLIQGADLKIAGVRAGRIGGMDVDRRTYRARVEFTITRAGFGDLREDVFCESRPQSLIGEYFLDCLPGRSPRKLRPGSTIPVERTASTVPLDLINNIMRRPYRERFSILLSELGAAFAGRGADLNETIRRLNPALREVDRVLAILAEQRRVIRDLYANAERVLTRQAANRRDVGRFFVEARDTAAAAAQRADSIRAQWQRLPVFLGELRPTLAALEESADAQIPALRRLHDNAGRLRAFFNALGPFADASRPATRTLAAAARTGRPAVRAARPRIAELRRFAAPLPELSRNLAYVLEDLDSRERAVERDPRSPEGRGYTGLEAVLQYVFNQSQAINLFDSNSYILKVSAFLDSPCAKNPALDRCAAILGPRRPGINEPDPSEAGPRAAARAREAQRDQSVLDAAQQAAGSGPGGGGGTGGRSGPAAPPTPGGLGETIGSLLGGGLLPPVQLPQAQLPQSLNRDPGRDQSAAGLLDYLLAP
jgi:virulence factor Mce-like protein